MKSNRLSIRSLNRVILLLAAVFAVAVPSTALSAAPVDFTVESPADGKIFKLADAAQGHDLLIGPDGFLPTFAHAAPPLKQQAGGDAIKPGNG